MAKSYVFCVRKMPRHHLVCKSVNNRRQTKENPLIFSASSVCKKRSGLSAQRRSVQYPVVICSGTARKTRYTDRLK